MLLLHPQRICIIFFRLDFDAVAVSAINLAWTGTRLRISAMFANSRLNCLPLHILVHWQPQHPSPLKILQHLFRTCKNDLKLSTNDGLSCVCIPTSFLSSMYTALIPFLLELYTWSSISALSGEITIITEEP